MADSAGQQVSVSHRAMHLLVISPLLLNCLFQLFFSTFMRFFWYGHRCSFFSIGILSLALCTFYFVFSAVLYFPFFCRYCFLGRILRPGRVTMLWRRGEHWTNGQAADRLDRPRETARDWSQTELLQRSRLTGNQGVTGYGQKSHTDHNSNSMAAAQAAINNANPPAADNKN